MRFPLFQKSKIISTQETLFIFKKKTVPQKYRPQRRRRDAGSSKKLLHGLIVSSKAWGWLCQGWRIIPISKWLICPWLVSPLGVVGPLPSGLFMAYKWGVIKHLLSGMILQVVATCDTTLHFFSATRDTGTAACVAEHVSSHT